MPYMKGSLDLDYHKMPMAYLSLPFQFGEGNENLKIW